ncbi:MAG: hypothetical protein IT198_07595 [Acidimicrobiia bacterium]|nr:hypothetical protein [Acidimicrobiia bacterium]
MEDTRSADTWDRTHLVATAAVAAVVLAFTVGLPLVDTFVEPRTRDAVAAGTQIVLSTDRNEVAAVPSPGTTAATFVPAAGWGRSREHDSPRGSVVLAHDGISFEVRVVETAGEQACPAVLRTAARSLEDLDPTGTLGSSRTFVTDAGHTGLTAPFLGSRVEGLAFAVCAGAVAVTAVATGPVGSLNGVSAPDGPVMSMTRSIEIA